ncbi:MAG: radical SAM protein [Anaerolineae bacterium]|nr:MAG: radical SAM protein [Anaerolineae bacterium]
MERGAPLSNRELLQREIGTVYKDWGGRLPVALAFPNTYYLGMSSLAVHTLYRLLNSRPDVVCERVFWNGGGAKTGPLRSLESGRDVGDFSVLAFSVSFEMDYFNLVAMLRQAGLPLWAGDRDGRHPLLIAGGPAVTANPEPLAPFFDGLAIGEGEVILPPLIDLLHHAAHEDRPALLAALAHLPGLYVPDLHQPPDPLTTRPPNHLTTQPPNHSPPQPIRRQWLRDLDAQPSTTAVLTPDTEFGDRFLIEIGRGCGRGCHFCLAGYAYRPPREVSLEVVLREVARGLRHRDRVGLVSAAVSDHSQIDELAVELRRMGARLSVSSMRVDPVSEPLLRALAESGTRTLTLAPEAGSERLRRFINKTQTQDDVLRAADLAARYGFHRLKLYFMIGQPTETEADVAAVADLALQVKARFRGRVAIDATPYVPKAHTPFQRVAMAPAKVIEQRLRTLRRTLGPRGVAVRADSPAWAAVQGILARGDQWLARVLARLPDKPSLADWRRALGDEGLDAQAYLRERQPDERLPWEVVDSGVSQDYLAWAWKQAKAGVATPACPPSGCLRCGVCDEAWALRDHNP